MRIVVFIFIALILYSLFSGLYFVVKDKGQSDRAVKALTWRVVLSIAIFAILMLSFHFGLIGGKI
ncbi:MAG TPA: twin transmembrane helix small protein [Burkholderiales bacterium]|nr:twin transmembrane helix small protein [Burkholderiales bacterium]